MHEGGKNAKFMASQRVLPALIPQFLVLRIITMRKLTLFYVPDHASGFWGGGGGGRRRREEMYLQSFSFLFLADLGIMTGSFLISRKLTALG